MASTLRVILFFCVLGTFAVQAFAGEVKIVDAHGLVRALKVVREKAQVIIEIKAAPGGTPEAKVSPSAISLVRSDGISGEIHGHPGQKTGEFVFDQVGEGVWQIKDGNVLPIGSVAIVPQ